MSEQDPESRPAGAGRGHPGSRPATVRDVAASAVEAAAESRAALQRSLLPVFEAHASIRQSLVAMTAPAVELLGTRPAPSSGAAPGAPVGPGPPAPDLGGHERAQIEEALQAADSENTLRAYRSQWQRFARYCAGRREQALPAHPVTVAAYLAARADEGVGVATLRQAAAAIAWVHNGRELDNPCAGVGAKKLLKGLARKDRRAARQARGLTREGLAAVRASALGPRCGKRGRLEKEAAARRRGLLDVALCELMYSCLLRRSEAAAVRWRDLTWMGDGSARLQLGHSKTDQEGEGRALYVLPRAVRALEAIRPPRPGPEERVFELSPSQISRRIAAAARAAGLGEGYSGHSPRVGAAQDLVERGASLVGIQNAGRWRSAAMPALYARNQLAGRGAVAQHLAEGRDGPGGPLRPDFGAERPATG